jgi:hypothetical protein
MPALSFILLASTALAQTTLPDDSLHWGNPVAGLSVGIAVRPLDRAEFHPGETVRIYVSFKADGPLLLPKYIAVNIVDLHVITPDGHEYVLEGYGKDRTTPLAADDWESVTDREPDGRSLILTIYADTWFDAATQKVAPVSLRDPGEYRIWAQADVEPRGPLPDHAWTGHAKSGEAKWKTTELPPENRLKDLTAKQSTVLDAWLSGKDRIAEPTGQTLWVEDWLTGQMQLTKNEPLAQKMLQIAKGGGQYAAGALKLLSARAGPRYAIGIDGPYLTDLATWELDQLQGKGLQPGAQSLVMWEIPTDVWVYLAFHPNDQAVRQRMIDIAKQSALADKRWSFPTADKPTGPHPPIFMQPAWDALLYFQIIRPGMTLDEAVKLLGPPQEQSPDRLDWHTAPNPGQGSELHASLRDGKITEWTRKDWPTDTGG